MNTPTMGRRAFLQITAGTGLWLAASPLRVAAAGPGDSPAGDFQPSAWLNVDPTGAVTVWLGRSEMGQGTFTGMAVLVAEELEADWKRVRVVQADADPRYGRMSTGGSSSVRQSWEPLRKAGAAAREMLVAAAAAQWGVDPGSCRAAGGAVLHPASGRSAGYGELAATAAKLPVPEKPRLKDPKDFTLIGKAVPRLDTPPKTRGAAVFGIDVRVPGMLHAVVARPPSLGGKVAGFDAAKALAVPGVRKVVEVPSGVAVLADTTWAAMRGREALSATFEGGPNGALDSAAIARLVDAAPLEPSPAKNEGDVDKALAGAKRKLSATYTLPFLAHATMEPMNCTARVDAGGAELWIPTQAPLWARGDVAKALGIPDDQVTVHTTFLGGGFGRRSFPDFPVEAALVAKAAGVPVQVTWSREDDFLGDYFRPCGKNELRAGLDAKGNLVAWHHLVRSPSISRQNFGGRPGHPDVLEGAIAFPYRAGAVRIEAAVPTVGVRLGWWRSVYASQNAFPEECFLDELAHAAGKDPLAFRKGLLPADHPLQAVLALAGEKSSWGKKLPRGMARGIACHSSFGSHVAEVAEVSLAKGSIRVHRVVVAVSCGTALNPDSVAHQMEGSVVYGLSAALRGEITFAKGAAQQANFPDQDPLHMSEMPRVETHIVPSTAAPGGIGEPGLPPIAPAVANALFALTGKRLRSLPLKP
ncbi:MAG: molybdopterin-binding xanthine dehydrogenase [Anaeromyxobacteraceae bacterium]|nr:molybdopterin-binding xanthine dehydrogenase [Anaeromyxobacteraceae bacterium]